MTWTTIAYFNRLRTIMKSTNKYRTFVRINRFPCSISSLSDWCRIVNNVTKIAKTICKHYRIVMYMKFREFTIEYFITTYWIINHADRCIDVDWHIKTYRIRIQDVKTPTAVDVCRRRLAPVTSAVSTEEGLTGTTSNTLPSECPDADQSGAVNEGTWELPATDDSSEHRVRTTPWSIEWERCRARYGGTEFIRWIQVTESTWGKHYADRASPISANEERGIKTTTCGNWYMAHELYWADRTNRR